ncbi:Cys-tRNA(Pro) deacylase [Gayadomonas joobiniege]|uniref:Cys-tRNA(Pro) deacylase n=1 Tax=Gayadomonas joobiniege TaxID=1234606 RepID=UPI000363096C|nr:Cys-tRNA(Pro) deacylase [Gayadomonas joobiniege]
MTPAVNLLKKLKIDFNLHEYIHDEKATSYGLEAAEKLAVPAQKVFKTLLVCNEKQQLFVAIVPVCQQLNLKLAAKAAGCKKMQMADKAIAEKTTGYILGGVSPFAQKKKLATLVDISAMAHNSIFVSGGKRGLEIELAPQNLINVLNAKAVALC